MILSYILSTCNTCSMLYALVYLIDVTFGLQEIILVSGKLFIVYCPIVGMTVSKIKKVKTVFAGLIFQILTRDEVEFKVEEYGEYPTPNNCLFSFLPAWVSFVFYFSFSMYQKHCNIHLRVHIATLTFT